MMMIHARVSFSKKLQKHPMINLRAVKPYFDSEHRETRSDFLCSVIMIRRRAGFVNA